MTVSPDMQDILLLVGRIMLVFLFVQSGITKAIRFQDGLAEVNAKHLPLPHLALLGTIALQLVAGGLIIIGRHVPLAAAVMAVFTLATAVVFYDFWSKQGAERTATFNGFLEHISIIGGFLVLIVAGPGRLAW